MVVDRARRVDLLVAAVLFAWAAPDVPWWWRPPGHVPGTPAVLGYLALALIQSVPFVWWRRIPVVVLGLTSAVLAIRLGLHRDVIASFACVLVAAYGLGAHSSRVRPYARWLGWLGLVVGAGVAATSGGARMNGAPYALVGAAFLVGDAASARRNVLAAAVEAAHVAERTRIARELHDVLAHQLSAIAVQAGTARMTGQAPADALGAVERLAREAMTELGHLLGALRRDVDIDAGLRPAPTLASLSTLLEEARAAGTPVHLRIDGVARELSPGLELSAYRVVQESLTNVARHAPGARTSVVLTYARDALEVDVVNEPSAAGTAPHRDGAAASPTGGRGLRGMRERAQLYGGDLDVCAVPGGGFAVRASFKYGAVPGVPPPAVASSGMSA